MASEDFEDVRLSTPGGISYKRVHGYPTYEEDMKSCHGEDEWIVHTADLDALLAEIIDQQTTEGLVHLGTLPMTGYTWLRAAKVRVTAHDMTRPCNPLGADADADILPALADTYGDLLRVHIWFEATSNSFFQETNLSAGAEFLHVSPNMLNVSESTNGDPITSNYVAGQQQASKANTEPSLGVYKQVPTIVWDCKVCPWVDPPWDEWFAAIGKLNSTAHEDLCNSAPPETVLFAGISATRTYRWYRFTDPAWDVNFKFAQRCVQETLQGTVCIYGWNHVYMPKEGHWTKLSRRLSDGTKKHLYEVLNIAELLGMAEA